MYVTSSHGVGLDNGSLKKTSVITEKNQFAFTKNQLKQNIKTQNFHTKTKIFSQITSHLTEFEGDAFSN